MRINLYIALAGTVALILGATTGCEREPSATTAAKSAVPVEVMTLRESNPARRQRLTGAVMPWKQEDVGFEVAGRVEWVVEEGAELVQSKNSDGDSSGRGASVIARLDSAPYERKVEQLKAAIAARRARLNAIEVTIKNVLPEQAAEAAAELELAGKNLERIRQLVEDGAAPASQLDDAQANYRTAQARENAVNARIRAQKAEREAIAANLRETQQELAQAEADLDNCTLHAPFPGRVAEVFVIPGGYVQPGQPVVKMVVMDPLKIELAVAAETDREIHYGDEVTVYPPDWPDPVSGTVFRKSTAADPQTRTFRITVLMRNFKVAADLWTADQLHRLLSDPALNIPEFNRKLARVLPEGQLRQQILEREGDDENLNRKIVAALLNNTEFQARLERELKTLPEAGDVWPLQRSDAGSFYEDPAYVAQAALYESDEGNWYTWQVANLKYGEAHKSLLRLKRVPVVPGEKEISLLGLFRFRKLLDKGSLTAENLVASGVPSELENDEPLVRFIRQRWLLRPGQLLPVRFGTPGPGRGIYVPATAVLAEGEQRDYVFLARDQNGRQTATRTPVAIRGRIGEQVKIEGDGVNPGKRLIKHGQHYVVDDHPINIVDIFED